MKNGIGRKCKVIPIDPLATTIAASSPGLSFSMTSIASSNRDGEDAPGIKKLKALYEAAPYSLC
jgi:hypothetical protein